MKTIMVKDHIETAFSTDDANILKSAIDKVLDENERVILDFTGITIFTSLFMGSMISKYIQMLGPEDYKNKIQVWGLSDLGQETYDHSLAFATEWHQLTDEEKEKYIKIFTETMEDT